MSKSDWVNKKKDLSESNNAVKKEKTKEEKRALVKEGLERRHDVVKSGKKDVTMTAAKSADYAITKKGGNAEKENLPPYKRKQKQKNRPAEKIKGKGMKPTIPVVSPSEKVISAVRNGIAGTVAASGQVVSDSEADTGGSSRGNALGNIAYQSNRAYVSKKHSEKQNKKKNDVNGNPVKRKNSNNPEQKDTKSSGMARASVVGAMAAAGQIVDNAQAGESVGEGNAFNTMAEQTNQTFQMMDSLGKVPESFRKSVLGKQQERTNPEIKAKRCGVKVLNHSNGINTVKQNPDKMKQCIVMPKEKEKKICSTEERKKSKKKKKKKGKNNKKGKNTAKIGKIQKIASAISSVFSGELADGILNAMKAGAPFFLFIDVVFTAFVFIILAINGFISVASEAARHPVSFFLEDSEEETSGENYLRKAVQAKEAEFDKEIEDFLAEDPEYHEVIYDGGMKTDWKIWEDSICVAYLARIFVTTGESTEDSDAAYPLLDVDTDKEKEVLDEIFHQLHFTETTETEIEVPDGTETIENDYELTKGALISEMNIEDHVCGFSHRNDYEKWDNHYIPCLVSESSGIEIGTVLQAGSQNQTAGLKYQVVGFDKTLDDGTISVCQNLKCNPKIYPCKKDLTILSGKKIIHEEVEQTVYKTVTKKTMTVYHYSLTEWQSRGINGNFPSDEESEVVDEMNSLLN